MAVEQWHAYLQQQEFLIRTDQKIPVHLEEQRLTAVWKQKAFTKLLGLRYRICYRKGQENRAADTLSHRQHTETLAVHTIIKCQPAWLDELCNSYATNKHALQWIQKLQLAPDAKGHFSVKDGLLYL
jgi:hypothetical protein